MLRASWFAALLGMVGCHNVFDLDPVTTPRDGAGSDAATPDGSDGPSTVCPDNFALETASLGVTTGTTQIAAHRPQGGSGAVIYTVSPSGTAAYVRSDGGVYEAATPLSTVGARDVVIGDVTSDGRDDVMVATTSPSILTFVAGQSLPVTSNTTQSPLRMVIGPFNAEPVDLAWISATDLIRGSGNGTGSFGVGALAANIGPIAIAAVPLQNGSSGVATVGTDELLRLWVNGTITTQNVGPAPQAVAAGLSSNGNSLIAVSRGDGTTELFGVSQGALSITDVMFPTPDAERLVVFDVNGDGRLDIVTAGPNTLTTRLATESGGFGAGSSFMLTAGVVDLAVARIDNNASPDLVALQTTGAVAVFLNCR